MAKIFDRKITSTTLAERKEFCTRLRDKLAAKKSKRAKEKLASWDAATDAQRLKFADDSLKQHGKRDKAGAIDWNKLMEFIKFLFDLFAPLIIPKT